MLIISHPNDALYITFKYRVLWSFEQFTGSFPATNQWNQIDLKIRWAYCKMAPRGYQINEPLDATITHFVCNMDVKLLGFEQTRAFFLRGIGMDK